ncbi:uncharacterized protein LOC136078157 [Hydra vulgaris]|uniref:Uncharacterized protein LOC136078156 n=1 Tax=Hydra vulgaris TaxID=6087 RepID=A0ABM4BJS9_HYDVU
MIKTLFSFSLMVAITTMASACSDYSQQWCQANQVLCTQPSLIAFMSQYCEQTCNYCSIPGVLPVGCGNPSIQSSRVIAGITPTKGSWPWQVLLWQGGKAFCGGTQRMGSYCCSLYTRKRIRRVANIYKDRRTHFEC